MTSQRIYVSDAAAHDIIEQADWYESRSDRALATRWESAVSAAIDQIAERPNSGARCNFKSADARNIRRTMIEGFSKHLIFYRAEKNSILILRVIHGARDLESLF